MDNKIEEFITQIELINDIKKYDEEMVILNRVLLEEEYPEQLRMEIRNKQKYIKNKFSDEVNKEKMQEAKENVLEILQNYLKEEKKANDNNSLLQYLQNFYMFLEALIEKTLDKRSTIKPEDFQNLKIENEYDLQHFMYAVLKPLYPDIRKEVSEDSGVGAVRVDLKIPCLEVSIEAKCTRENMPLKKLTEEIEADIVHYKDRNIVFFIYDRAKIIQDKQNYESHFNHVFDGKNIKMIILQPIFL